MSVALFLRVLVGCANAEAPETRVAEESIAGRLQGGAVQFGDWVLGCNNLGNCTAIAAVREYEAGADQASVLVILGREAEMAPRVLIVRDGAVVEELAPEHAVKLIYALHDGGGADAVHVSQKPMRFDVPGNGFAAAMDALSQWRAAPVQQFLPTEAIIPLAAVREENLEPPPAVREATKQCPDGSIETSFQGWRGIAGVMLWRVGCGSEGLNVPSFWFRAGPQGSPPEIIEFDARPGSATMYNSWFDPDSGFVRSIHYFGGQHIYRHEDCGIYRAYSWGFGGMKLAEERFMPVCGTGIGPRDWITTYRAVQLSGPDSGP